MTKLRSVLQKKVIAEGDENLSQKQNYVFDTNVKNIFLCEHVRSAVKKFHGVKCHM